MINTDFTYLMVFKKVQHIDVFFEIVFFGIKTKKNLSNLFVYFLNFFFVTKMDSIKCNKSAAKQKKTRN